MMTAEATPPESTGASQTTSEVAASSLYNEPPTGKNDKWLAPSLVLVYVALILVVGLSAHLFVQTVKHETLSAEDYDRAARLYYWVSSASAALMGELAIIVYSLFNLHLAWTDQVLTKEDVKRGTLVFLLAVAGVELFLWMFDAGGKAAAVTVGSLPRVIQVWIQILNYAAVPTVALAAGLAFSLHLYCDKATSKVTYAARRMQTFFMLASFFLVSGVFEIYFSNVFADAFRTEPGICSAERLIQLFRDSESEICHPIRSWGKSLAGLASIGFSLIMVLVFLPLTMKFNRTLRAQSGKGYPQSTFDDWLQENGLFTQPVQLIVSAAAILAPLFTGLLARLI